MRRARGPAGVRSVLYGESPFGWRLSTDRSKLVLDPDEQRLLGVVRHMFHVERMNMRAIVERLDEMGVVNRRNRPFTLWSVWAMIDHGTRVPPEASVAKRKK
jgi:hypothetical protein